MEHKATRGYCRLLLAIILVSSIFMPVVFAEWFDQNWEYRKLHTINGSTNSTVTDMQMHFILQQGTGVDSGKTIYVNASNTNFSDVRFVLENGSLLDYYMEEVNNNQNASVWVKIDSIPADPANKTIYLYYNNPDAISLSNATNTFIVWEDFESTGNIFESHSSGSVDNLAGGFEGSTSGNPSGTSYHTHWDKVGGQQFARDTFFIEGWLQRNTDDVIPVGLHILGQDSGLSGNQIILDGRSSVSPQIRRDTSNSGRTNGNYLAASGVYEFWRAYTDGSNIQARIYPNSFATDVLGSATRSDSSYSTGYIGVFGYQSNDGRIDAIRVRKRIDPMPLSDITGAQEQVERNFSITISHPQNTTYSSIELDLNFTTTSPDLYKCWYSKNGGITNSTPQTCSNYTLIAPNGSNTWTVYANSTAGVLNSSSVSFTVNATQIQIALTSPQNTTYDTNTLDLSYTFVGSNVYNCWYSLDEGNTNSTPNTCNANFTSLVANEGRNDWIAYINNTASEVDSDIVTFTVDTITPSVSITSPLNTTYIDSELDLNYTVTDATNTQCWYNLGGANSSPTTCNDFTSLPVSDGSNQWSVYAQDSAGNIGSDTVFFFKNDTGPRVTEISLSSETIFNYTSEDLTCVFTENDFTNKTYINWIRNTTSTTLLYMPFEGNDSTLTDDISGLLNDGTNFGVTLVNGGANSSQAASFDGSSHINVDGVVNEVAGEDITILFWIKGSSTNQEFPVSFNDNSGNNRLMFGHRSGSNLLSVYDTNDWEDTTATVFDGQWHLVGLTLDDTNNQVNVTVDGSFIYNYTSTLSLASTDQFNLGMEYDGATESDFFTGELDQVTIFNRLLSAEQILHIYNNNTNVLANQETIESDQWQCEAIPYSTTKGTTQVSNTLTVGGDIPTSPSVALLSPSDSQTITNESFTFNVTAASSSGLANCTLYNNLTGTWQANGTNALSGTTNTTSWSVENIANAEYEWNSYCCTALGLCSYATSNNTFTVDYTTFTPVVGFTITLPGQSAINATSSGNNTAEMNFTSLTTTASNLEPCVGASGICQNSSQPFYLITNIGNVNLTIDLVLNQTLPAQFALTASPTHNPNAGTNLTTTPYELIANLTPTSTQDAFFFGRIQNVLGGTSISRDLVTNGTATN